MGTVSNVLEQAVRMGIDLSHLPGYQQIVASILGEEAAKPKAPALPPDAPKPQPPSDVEGAMLDALSQGVPSADGASLEGALDDDSFSMVLMAAAWDEGKDEEPEDETENQAIWSKVAKMTVPQKVRLALLGNDTVRSLLIRDTRRIVYLSVLNSPRTSDKEVILYARDRALNDEIIRTIAANRDWTKLYPVRFALVSNPKCPPVLAMQFVRSLNAKDIKHLSSSHEVPGYIARQAKQIMQAREAGNR